MAIDVRSSSLLSTEAGDLSPEVLDAYVEAASTLLHPCLPSIQLSGERARVASHALALQVSRMVRAASSGEGDLVSLSRGSRSWTYRSTKSGGAITVDPVAAGMIANLGLDCGGGFNSSRSARGPQT